MFRIFGFLVGLFLGLLIYPSSALILSIIGYAIGHNTDKTVIAILQGNENSELSAFRVLGTVLGLILATKSAPFAIFIFPLTGFFLGRGLDLRITRNIKRKIKQHSFSAFFKQRHHRATISVPIIPFFSLLGHICKSDGVITKAEIAQTERIIQELNLMGFDRTQAIHAFRHGKQKSLIIEDVCMALRQACMDSPMHLQLMFKWMLDVAQVDNLTPAKRDVLMQIARNLNISFRGQETIQEPSDAYKTLGVSPQDSPDAIKKAYRKLVGKYHPDRLPPNASQDEINTAAEKMIRVKKAYDSICKNQRNPL